MPRRRAARLILLLGFAAGCRADDGASLYFTESKSWSLVSDHLQADVSDLPGSVGRQQDEPMLVGTRWCPEISCYRGVQRLCPA